MECSMCRSAAETLIPKIIKTLYSLLLSKLTFIDINSMVSIIGQSQHVSTNRKTKCPHHHCSIKLNEYDEK